jgi:choline kinase
MKAIVLCAGRGNRLRPLTDERPKCLLSFCGKTILECCLEYVGASGIRDSILVTGYRKELIEGYILRKSLNNVTYVYNDRYESTNTAVSLNLALKVIEDDFILINGDVLFAREILVDLIRHPARHVIVVDTTNSIDQEAIKVIDRNGRVEKISKELDPKLSLGEAIGIYKVGRELIPHLIRIFDRLEQQGEFYHFFEKGFEKICEGGGDGQFFAISFTSGRPWIEIDTHKDFDHARREIFPRICG